MCKITKETYNVIRYEELISYLISPIWRGNVRCWWWSVFSVVVRDISERGCCWCFLTVGPPALCPELWSGLECETLLAVTSSPLGLDNISPGEQISTVPTTTRAVLCYKKLQFVISILHSGKHLSVTTDYWWDIWLREMFPLRYSREN